MSCCYDYLIMNRKMQLKFFYKTKEKIKSRLETRKMHVHLLTLILT